MEITQEYLDEFALTSVGKQPIEFKIHGWEMDNGNASITLDDEEGHSLSYIHWDDHPTTKAWKIKPGTDKRWTMVMLTKNGEIVGDVGWEFEGLIEPKTLRLWFLGHLGMAEKMTAAQLAALDKK